MTIELSACSDGELAALALGGRQAAYTELMNRHRAWVYRLARGHVGDPEDALDVTQGTFVAAFAALERYDNRRPFPVWLSRIAINKAHDWNRRKQVRRFFSFGLPISQATLVPDPAPLQDQVVGSEIELRDISRAIATLPAALKEVLLLRTVEAKSEAETAEILGISPKAVQTRLHRARDMLAKLFPQS